MTLKTVPQGVFSDLGLTHVAVTVKSFGSKESFTADFLVDTGAMDSMAPASELKRIGIEPVGTELYELANGERVEYQYGVAEFSLLGKNTAGQFIFGPDNSEPILGVIALETIGLIVDPKTQTVRRLRARPLKAVA